jgi:hypothetical protein
VRAVLNRLKNYLFKLYLRLRYNPLRLRRHIYKNSLSGYPKYGGLEGSDDSEYSENPAVSIEKSGKMSESKVNLQKVRIAALQVEMLYNNPIEFSDKMEELVFRAWRRGAELVAFPEDNLTQLLGVLPGLDNQSEVDGEDITVTEILSFIGPTIEQYSMVIFSALARKYGVYLMAGSGLFPYYQ